MRANAIPNNSESHMSLSESHFFKPSSMAKKAVSVRIINLPKKTHRQLRRALGLLGAGSQSQWVHTEVRKIIRKAQKEFGEDLFDFLTEEERHVLNTIASGAAEIPHIAEECLLSEKRVEILIADLIDRGFVERRKKGGKTAAARGAVIDLYFVTKKYTDLIK